MVPHPGMVTRVNVHPAPGPLALVITRYQSRSSLIRVPEARHGSSRRFLGAAHSASRSPWRRAARSAWLRPCRGPRPPGSTRCPRSRPPTWTCPVRYDLAPALRGSSPRSRSASATWTSASRSKARSDCATPMRRSAARSGSRSTVARRCSRPTCKYRARAWYNPPVLPEISAKCGKEGEEPRARLTVRDHRAAHQRAGPFVRAHAGGRRPSAQPRSRPLQGHVPPGGRHRQGDGGRRERAAAAADHLRRQDRGVRPAATRAAGSGTCWARRSKLTDSLWLVINPATVRIGMLKMHGDTLVTTVGLSANPRVIGGPRPDVTPPPLPEPRGLDLAPARPAPPHARAACPTTSAAAS